MSNSYNIYDAYAIMHRTGLEQSKSNQIWRGSCGLHPEAPYSLAIQLEPLSGAHTSVKANNRHAT